MVCKVICEDGTYGVGEGGGWPTICQKGVQEVAPILIGENPFDIERLWFKIYDILHGHGLTGSVRGGVIAAIDTALWDIKGKALDVPVYELLGGKVRDKIRIYGHASTIERAKELIDRGYTAFKGGFNGAQMAAMREELGYDVEIGVHCHGEYSPGGALRLAKQLEPFDPAFLEEPTQPEDVDALEWLSLRTSIPLGSGERLYSKWSFKDLIQRRAIEIAQPEITRLGILEEKKVAVLAECFSVKIAPHDGSAGPIAEMANLHVLASSPNCLYLEHKADDVPWRKEVAVGVIPDVDGYIPLPDLPGLGIDIDEEACEQHPPYEVDEVEYRFHSPEEMAKPRPD